MVLRIILFVESGRKTLMNFPYSVSLSQYYFFFHRLYLYFTLLYLMFTITAIHDHCKILIIQRYKNTD